MKHFDPIRLIIIILFMLVLSACATQPPAALPEQEEEAPSPVSTNPAVVALVDSALGNARTGNLDVASVGLERALRIESRNPRLWHELAQLRLQQDKYQQAISMAAKSNAWAGSNNKLRAKNWRIIGQAKAKRGDWQGAQEAFKKAEQEEQSGEKE